MLLINFVYSSSNDASQISTFNVPYLSTQWAAVRICLFDIITPPQNGPLSPSTAPSTLDALTRAATHGQSCIVVSDPPIILFLI